MYSKHIGKLKLNANVWYIDTNSKKLIVYIYIFYIIQNNHKIIWKSTYITNNILW